MSKNVHTAPRKGRVAFGLGVAAAMVPTLAMAEAPSGAELLLPKPAEFIPALIAFLVIWFVLAKFAWPSILGMMEKRERKIKDDLDAAEGSKLKAAEEQRAYADRIRDAHKEAEGIIASAKREGKEERSKIIAKAQSDAADIVAKAHGAVETERKKAMIELSSSVVDLAVEIAGSIIGDDLSEADQRKLAEKHLAEVSASDER